MKKVYGLFLCLFLAVNSFASTLIFKTSKTIQTNESTEIVNLDVSKYQKIRVGISFVGKETERDETLKINIEFAEKELERRKKLFSTGDISKEMLDKAQEKLDQAKRNYEMSLKPAPLPIIQMSANELDGDMLLDEFRMISDGQSFVIDVPPPKISIKVSGKGLYKLFIWAI